MKRLGLGIAKGMLTTVRYMLRPPVTVQYPEERVELTARSRASLGFDEDICIICAQCARACPHGLIALRVSAAPNGERVLEQYDIDFGYCLNCGLCVEACPTGAIHWTKSYELAAYRREDLIFTKERWPQKLQMDKEQAKPNKPLLSRLQGEW